MKQSVQLILDDLISRYPVLEPVKDNIADAYNALEKCFSKGNKLLICGNGGSSADSAHIVGVLMKSFIKKRPIGTHMCKNLEGSVNGDYLCQKLEGALPAISLCENQSLITAFANDVDPLLSFAQALYGIGKAGDVFIAISTSGNAKNCLYAAEVANAMDIKTIALTGKTGGALAKESDIAIIVPCNETYKIQELHLPIYHTLALMLEEYFWGL